jgi:hypothetical protein
MGIARGKTTGLIAVAALLALSVSPLAAQDRPIRQGSVEIILGRYDMNEPRFDAVYPKGGLLAGLGASAAIVSNLNLYLEAKYWHREGALTFSKEKTTLRLVPISIGARFIVPLGIINPYAGAGGDLYFYYEDNPIGTTANSAAGIHVMGGVYIRPAQRVPLMINLKVKYTWARTAQGGFDIQLGGLEYAGGLAFAF